MNLLMMDRQAFLQIRNENSTIKFIIPLCNKCSQTRAEQLYGEARCYFLLVWTKQFRLIKSLARWVSHPSNGDCMITFSPDYDHDQQSSWSVDHRTKLGPELSWFTGQPLEMGLLAVSVNSKTNLNFFLPHFLPRCTSSIHPRREVDGQKLRINWVEVSDLDTRSVLIDVVLVRADTRRAARHHLVPLGTPWQRRAPPCTPWYHPVPLGTGRKRKVPLIQGTIWHDFVVCQLDLILDVPLSYWPPIVVRLLEKPVKERHCYYISIAFSLLVS